MHLDVTRRADVEALVDQVVAEQGHLDVMVNNAAIIADGLVLDTTEEELDRVLAVNFKGVFFGCQAAGRVMSQQRLRLDHQPRVGRHRHAHAVARLLLDRQGRGGAAVAHTRHGAGAAAACG